MEILKGIAGLVSVAMLVLTILFVIFVGSWVFRIVGFLVAVALSCCVIGYIGWECISALFTKKP